MTRLVENDICDIERELVEYEKILISSLGCGMSDIAAIAVGCSEADIARIKDNFSVAAVPLRTGEGVIGGFAETVAAISRHLGFKSYATVFPDVFGISEACKQGADILMLADDDYFRALSFKNMAVADNSICTGEGYAAALEIAVGGLKNKKVLVVGSGQVGSAAAEWMVKKGASITIYNRTQERADSLMRALEGKYGTSIEIAVDLDAALFEHELILDASSMDAYIDDCHIQSNTYIAAPGMPLGLTNNAVKKIGSRLIHDPLQLGVAVMLYSILKQSADLFPA